MTFHRYDMGMKFDSDPASLHIHSTVIEHPYCGCTKVTFYHRNNKLIPNYIYIIVAIKP